MKTLSTIDNQSKSRSPWKATFDKEDRLNFSAIQKEESEFKRKIIHEPRRKESRRCKEYWFSVSTHNQEPFDHKNLRKFLDLLLCEDIRQTEIIFVEQKEHDEELEKFNKAKKLFDKELPSLLKKHKRKYAAVVGNDIIIDSNFEALFDKVTELYGDVTMYIDEIIEESEKPELYDVPKFAIE